MFFESFIISSHHRIITSSYHRIIVPFIVPFIVKTTRQKYNYFFNRTTKKLVTYCVV